MGFTGLERDYMVFYKEGACPLFLRPVVTVRVTHVVHCLLKEWKCSHLPRS